MVSVEFRAVLTSLTSFQLVRWNLTLHDAEIGMNNGRLFGVHFSVIFFFLIFLSLNFVISTSIISLTLEYAETLGNGCS